MNEAHIVSLEVRRAEILDEFRYERGLGFAGSGSRVGFRRSAFSCWPEIVSRFGA